MKALKFTNFTDTDFTWKFDSVDYTIKAGESLFLEDYKAYHFAKHLVDRELNNMGEPTNNVKLREKLGAKCFPEDIEVTPTEALNLNESKPKKVVKEKVKIEEFPDLKVNKEK